MRRQFEGSVYEDRHARTYTASIISLFTPVYARKMRVRIQHAVDPLPCGEILRAAFIGTNWQTDAVRLRGRRDFKVRRDFEEIQYIIAVNF